MSRPESKELQPQSGKLYRPESKELQPQSGKLYRPESKELQPQSGKIPSRPDSKGYMLTPQPSQTRLQATSQPFPQLQKPSRDMSVTSTMNINLSLKGVNFTLYDDTLDESFSVLPICKLEIGSVTSTILIQNVAALTSPDDPSGQSRGEVLEKVAVNLGCDDVELSGFNSELSTWEPIIEPASFGVTVFQFAEEKKLMVNVESQRMLNVNVKKESLVLVINSTKFVDRILSLMSTPLIDSGDLMQFDASTLRNSSAVREKKKLIKKSHDLSEYYNMIIANPYFIRNLTGSDILLYLNQKKDQKTLLKNRSECPIDVAKSFRTGKKQKAHRNTLSFSLLSDDPTENNRFDLTVENVQFRFNGTKMFPVSSIDMHAFVAVDVQLENGIKYIIIRSPYYIANNTSYEMEIALGYKSLTRGEQNFLIPAHATFSIPIRANDFSECRYRPVIDTCEQRDVNWCRQAMMVERKVNAQSVTSGFLICQYKANSEVWMCKMVIRRPTPQDTTVTLNPPNVIENLIPFPIKMQYGIATDAATHNFSSTESENLEFRLTKKGVYIAPKESVSLYTFAVPSLGALKQAESGRLVNRTASLFTGGTTAQNRNSTVESAIENFENFIRSIHMQVVLDGFLTFSENIFIYNMTMNTFGGLTSTNTINMRAVLLRTEDPSESNLKLHLKLSVDPVTSTTSIEIFSKYFLSNLTGLPLVFFCPVRTGMTVTLGDLPGQVRYLESEKNQLNSLDPHQWYSTEYDFKAGAGGSSNATRNSLTNNNSSLMTNTASNTKADSSAMDTNDDMIFIGPSARRVLYGNSELNLRLANSQSNFIKLDLRKLSEGVKLETIISLPDNILNRTYEFCVTAYPGPGKFENSFVVQINARVMFVNTTGTFFFFTSFSIGSVFFFFVFGFGFFLFWFWFLV
jgi:hypothetical protein